MLSQENKKILFKTSAMLFFFTAGYFLLKIFLPIEKTLIFFSISAFVIFIIGILVWKNKRHNPWYSAFIISSMIVLFITTMVSVITGFIVATKAVVILSGIVYLLAALIFKQEIFLYLLTVDIAILFFNFLQTSSSTFTQNLFIYLLYGIIFIGILFTTPYIKKLRHHQRVFMMFTISNWKGILFYSIPACLIILMVIIFYSIKITEHPQFCGTCHYMDEYIKSWEHSGHNNVKCVDCHYEPGVKAVAKGKIAGLLQMAKYMTHTYSSKPVAEVSDKSCLREGCHDKMDRKAPVVFSEDIIFSHSKHLDQDVRQHKLRCSTCHSQSVSGKHLAITKSACFICHFKDRKPKYSDCNLCHKLPDKVVGSDDKLFNHKEFLSNAKDVSCVHCHKGIIRGNGDLLPDNCLFCHTKKDATKKVGIEEIHKQHVTEHKVECFQCHVNIKHNKALMKDAREFNCVDCHKKGHSIQEQLYMGKGVKGIDEQPDPMYLASVDCQGCHKETKEIKIGEQLLVRQKTPKNLCDGCHGEGYNEMMNEWQNEIRQEIVEIGQLLDTLKSKLFVFKYGYIKGTDPAKDKKIEAINKLLKEIDNDYEFIKMDKSLGVHNINYTNSVIEKIKNAIKEVFAEIK